MKIFGVELKFKASDIWHAGNFDPNTKVDKSVSEIPFVIGTQTTTTASWTGVADSIDGLYNGLTIRYWLPRTSASNVTLNLTLKGGATTGPINCYYGGVSRLTTHYPAGSFIMLTYIVNGLINGTAYTGWWAKANYVDGTESYAIRWNSTHKVGAAVYSYKLCMFGTDGLLYPLTLETGTGTTKTVSVVEFAIDSPILYYGTTTTIAANGTSSSYWYKGVSMGRLHYTANIASGWTAYKPIYLKGIITAAGNFKLDNTTFTSWLTQTLPTSDDGFVYMLVGHMYDTTVTMRLLESNLLLQYKNGKIRPYVSVSALDVGLGNVDNTADANKAVLSATKLATPRKINGVNFDGTAAITIADSTKEPSITGSTVSTFWSGLKTFRDLATDVRAIALTGLSVATNSAIVATDTILVALGKLQAQITGHTGSTSNPHSVTATQVGLGNVTNESKATMFTNAALTGTPTAPTPATGDNDTSIATTAFVKAQGYITSSSAAKITVSATAPASPIVGEFWYQVL